VTLSLRDRISGGLFGLLVGDALGVPYEFCAASDLPDPSAIEFVPPKGFRRSHSSVPPSTWSDDGAQALCLLASLLERGCLDLLDFSKKLLRWYDEGAFTPDRKVFDCGIQTRAAIEALRSGVAPERSGPPGEWDNGNGSLNAGLAPRVVALRFGRRTLCRRPPPIASHPQPPSFAALLRLLRSLGKGITSRPARRLELGGRKISCLGARGSLNCQRIRIHSRGSSSRFCFWVRLCSRLPLVCPQRPAGAGLRFGCPRCCRVW